MAKALFIQDGDNGVVSEIQLSGKLVEYQTLVDGLIELVETPEVIFVCNEEAIVVGKPPNLEATAYLWSVVPEYTGQVLLFGCVVLIGQSDELSQPTNVPQSALEFFELT